MASRVPTYDDPQVTARPTPGARVESIATPAFLGSAADSDVNLASGALKAGTGISAIAVHMQEKENLRAVQDALTDYGNRVLDFQTKAQKERTGAGAAGLITEFGEWQKKQVEDIAPKLGNEAQRRAFGVAAQKSGLAARHGIATFEIGETRKADNLSHEARSQNLIDLGAVAATSESADVFKKQLVDGTKAFAATQNFDADVTEALVSRRLTDFHAQRIQQLARDNPAAAEGYFNANKNEIAGSKRAEIGAFAEKAGVEIAGVTTGGEIWNTVGPAQGLDVMEEAARKKYTNDPNKLKATIANLRERTAAYDKGQQERAEAVAGKVSLAALNGAPASKIRTMPEFIALSNMGAAGAKQAQQVIEHVENRQLRQISLANAQEARQQAALTRRGYAAYLSLSDPEKLAGMSRDQILAQLPTLGNELTAHLMQRKDSLVKTEGKVLEAKMDQDDFNQVAAGAGLKPFDPHKSEDERAALGLLKFQIENKIDIAQRAKGKLLTREEKKDLVQQEMDNKVMVDRTLWFDSEKPFLLLNKKEQENAYVTVEGKEVRLAAIPKDDVRAITISLQKHGLPVTQKAVAEMWLKKTKQKTEALK